MEFLYKNKHWPVNKEYNFDILLYLMIDRPNVITHIGDLIWTNNRREQNHREYDLPAAYINKKHNLCWFRYNELHRNNKPTIICSDGYKLYYTNNKLIRTVKI